MAKDFSEYLKNQKASTTSFKPTLEDVGNQYTTQIEPVSNKTQDFLYKVKGGDTLGVIAKEFGVSIKDITNVNKIPDINKIYIDQEILIPGQEKIEAGVSKEFVDSMKDTVREEIIPVDYVIKTNKPDFSSWQFNIPKIGDKLRRGEIAKYEEALRIEQKKWTDEYLKTLKNTSKEDLKNVTAYGSSVLELFNKAGSGTVKENMYPEIDTSDIDYADKIIEDLLEPYKQDYGLENFKDLQDFTSKQKTSYDNAVQELVDLGYMVKNKDGVYELTEEASKQLENDQMKFSTDSYLTSGILKDTIISSLFDTNNITDIETLKKNIAEIGQKYGDIVAIDKLEPAFLDLNRLYIISNDVDKIDAEIAKIDAQLNAIPINSYEAVLNILEQDLTSEEMVAVLATSNIDVEILDIVLDGLDKKNNLIIKRNTLIDIDADKISDDVNTALNSVEAMLVDYAAKEDLEKIFRERTDLNESEIGLAIKGFLSAQDRLNKYSTGNFDDAMQAENAASLLNKVINLTKIESDLIKGYETMDSYLSIDKSKAKIQEARQLEGAQLKNLFNKEYQDIDFGQNLSTIMEKGMEKLGKSFAPVLNGIMWYQDEVIGRGILAGYKTLSAILSQAGQQSGEGVGIAIMKARGKSDEEIKSYIRGQEEAIAYNLETWYGLPDGATNPVEVFKHYRYDDYDINNINENTTKTFKLTHDGTLERMLPESQKYMKAKIQAMNPTLDMDNLKAGDTIIMPMFDMMIRYLDGSIPDQDRYEYMAQHPTLYEITNQGMEIVTDPFTWVTAGLTDIAKVAIGQTLPSSMKVFKTLAAGGKAGEKAVIAADKAALKLTQPIRNINTAYTTTTNPTIVKARNGINFTNEIMKGISGIGMDIDFVKKNKLDGLNDAFQKWRGVTTAKLFPTPVSDAIQSMLKRSGLDLIWESKVKSAEALKEMRKYYEDTGGKKVAKKEVSDKVFEILVNPGSGNMAEWGVLEKYGITKTGLIDKYKKIIDNPIVGFIAKDDNLWQQIVSSVNKVGNEYAAKRKSYGWIVDYTKQNVATKDLFQKLYETASEKESKKVFIVANNEIDNLVKNGLAKAEDAAEARRVYKGYQNQTKEAVELANTSANVISVPDNLYEVEFDINSILTKEDFENARTYGLVLTDKNTGMQKSFPANTSAFEIRDFIFNAYHNENVNNLKAINAIREAVEYETIPTGTVGYKRTINNTKKIVAGTEKRMEVLSTKWQTTMKNVDGNEVKIVIDATNKIDAKKQLKENKIKATSEIVPQYDVGQPKQHSIIIEARIERVKKNGKKETYIEKDWRAFDEKGNVYDVVDVKKGTTLELFEAGNTAKNFTLWELLLESADEVNFKIWKKGNPKTIELEKLLEDYGKQKEKLPGHNTVQKDIFNTIEKDYNGIPEYLEMASNVENEYLSDRIQFDNEYKVLKSSYDQGRFKKLDGTFKGTYEQYLKLRDEKLKFLLMDKLIDRKDFNAVIYKNANIKKGRLLTESQSKLLNGKELTSIELKAIASEYDSLFNRKIKRDSSTLSDMKIKNESYLDKFGNPQTIEQRLNNWLDIKKIYVEEKPKKIISKKVTPVKKPTYKKVKGEAKQVEIVGGGSVRTREHYAKNKRIPIDSDEGMAIASKYFIETKESISKETTKVREKKGIPLYGKTAMKGRDRKFFIDAVEKYKDGTGIEFFSLGKSRNISGKISDAYLKTIVYKIKKAGVHTIIGVDMPTSLVKKLNKNDIKVISITDAEFKRYKNIGTEQAKKLTVKDIEKINEIRDIYLNEKRIEFWGKDNHGYEFKKVFTNKLLSDFERRSINIHNNRLEAYNKLIYGEKRVRGHDVAFAKDLDDPLLTIEPDPIKSILRSTEESIGYARENNIKAEIRLGKIDKKIVEFNEWKATKERPVRIAVVSKDTPFIIDEFKNAALQRSEQGATFVLPIESKMNIGEKSIKEFFDDKNIKYVQEDIVKLGKDEYLLSNGVPSGKGANSKYLLFKDATTNHKQVYSYMMLKEKLIREIDDVITVMKKGSFTLPSRKIRQDLKKGLVSTEEAMQRIYASNVRRGLRKEWATSKITTINKYRQDQRNLWAISTGKSVSEIPKIVTDQIEKDINRMKNSLNGLDKHVFQWEKNPSNFEQKLLDLREKVEAEIKNSGDAKAIEELILNDNITSSKYVIANGLYKVLFRYMPKVGRKLRGAWIYFILKYRPGWYVWNALDDTSKYFMSTKDVVGTAKLLLSQMEAAVTYMAMGTKDVGRIGLSLINMKEIARSIKKIAGENSNIYKQAQKLQKFASETKLFDKELLSSKKGLISYNREKLIKDLGVNNATKLINIIEKVNGARDKLYGKDFKVINDLIDNGGVIDDVVVPAGALERIIDSGMVSEYTGAKTAGKEMLYKGLSSDTWAERVGESFKKFDTDLTLFGAVTEDARRSYAAYKLMQQNSVDLVKTNMMIKEFFFDYRDLTKAAQLFRIMFPFLTYSIKSAELYTKLVLKYYGYPAFRAGQAILKVWDTMVGDMESYNQEKFKIGNVLFRANFSLLEYLRFVQDPTTAIKIWAQNPQRAPLGLGFSPLTTQAVGMLTGADYFDLTRTELKDLGWTNESIEKYLQDQDERKIEYNKETNPIKGMLDFIIEVAPALKVARQLLSDVDDTAMRNPGHILKYKTFREVSKFLGLNITEYTDYDEFTTKLNRLDPALRNNFIQKMKAESPEMYKQLQQNTLIGVTINALKGKLTEEEAREAVQDKIYQQTFYDMEAKNKGSGYTAMAKLPEMKKALDKVWSKASGTYAETKAKRAEMYQQDKIIRAYIEDNIPSNLTSQENVNKYKILGADFDMPISKAQLKYDLLGKGLTKEQVNTLLEGMYSDTGIPLLTDAEVLRIKTESMEYDQLSKEEKTAKSLADQTYYKKLSAAQRVFPINYSDLTKEEQGVIYNKYLASIKKNLSEEEYTRWLNDRPEIEVKFKKYQKEYINRWGKLIADSSQGKYYESFNKEPEWFKEFYFSAHPNARLYYPLQAEKEKKMSEIIAKEQQGFDMSDERKVFDEWYWSQTKAIDALKADDPDKVKYMKEYKAFQSKVTPENYYTELLNQNDWFKEQYFEKNPEAKEYAKTLAKLESLTGDDDKKAYSELLNSFATTDAGKKYADTHPIMGTHSKLEYRILWNDIINNSSKETSYYNLFFKSPEWFKKYYFNRYPVREEYYSFRKELASKEGAAWSNFLWSTANTKARDAWFKDKPEDKAYYTNYIKPLSAFTSVKNWGSYYDFLLEPKNKEYFKRWSDGDVKKEQAAYLSRDYYKLPEDTWEDKKTRSEWLDVHTALRKYWDSDKTEKEKKLSNEAKEYYDLKYNIENSGSGYDYYYQFKKNEADRAHLLKTNPALAKYLYRNRSEMADEEGTVISKLKEYNKIYSAEDKKRFINENPDVSEYFMNNVPDGIKNIRKLQEEYFGLKADNKSALAEKKSNFLKDNPELKVYWDVNALPNSAFTDKVLFTEWQKKWNKIERYFDKVSVNTLSDSESIRNSLPAEYITPGNSQEGQWMQYKVYGAAMSKWIELMGKNKTAAMYYFRQLPAWVREKYYKTHPENRWMNGVSLKSWIATGSANYFNKNKAEAWALEQQYKYGNDMPVNIKKQVENILIRSGQWQDRSNWDSAAWDKYWSARSAKLSGLKAYDYATMPLLRSELAKVTKLYPVLLVNNSNYVKYLKPTTWNRDPLLTRI